MKKMQKTPFIVIVSLTALVAACSDSPRKSDTTGSSLGSRAGSTIIHASHAFTKTDVRLGVGAPAMSGQEVLVHYTGWIYDPSSANRRGAQFDSSRNRREPFSFPLGAGKVIKGWDEGVAGMKIGGKRTLIIPSDMAYGARGAGSIPPHATLMFDVELFDIK